MRNGRRSALRALAASHCVIVAAGRAGGGYSGSAPRTALSARHAARAPHLARHQSGHPVIGVVIY
jgi:hypothetical protein